MRFKMHCLACGRVHSHLKKRTIASSHRGYCFKAKEMLYGVYQFRD